MSLSWIIDFIISHWKDLISFSPIAVVLCLVLKNIIFYACLEKYEKEILKNLIRFKDIFILDREIAHPDVNFARKHLFEVKSMSNSEDISRYFDCSAPGQFRLIGTLNKFVILQIIYKDEAWTGRHRYFAKFSLLTFLIKISNVFSDFMQDKSGIIDREKLASWRL